MKVSHKVALIASTIATLAFTAFSVIQFYTVKEALYEKTESNIEEASAGLAFQVTNWLNGKLALIDLMAQNIDAEFSQKNIQKAFDSPLLKQEFLLIFGGLETDGAAITNDSSWNPQGWDARKRPWYPYARNNSRAVLTDPYADASTNEILISAVANFSDNGVFKGAFGGDLSLKVISDAVNKLNFGGTGYTFLLGSKDNIISHPNAELNGKQLSELFSDSTPEIAAAVQDIMMPDGQRSLVYFSPLLGLHGSDWKLGVVLDYKKVMRQATLFGWSAVIGALLSAVACSIILYFTMVNVLRPLNDLRNSLADINSGDGDLTKRLDIQTNDEFFDVANELNQFIDYLQKLVGDIKGVSVDIRSHTQDTSEIAVGSASELQTQADELDQLATAMTEMSATAHEVAHNAQATADASTIADSSVNKGVLVVSEATSSLQQLSVDMEAAVSNVTDLAKCSNNIESVLTVITEIAEQTNLLALNAAIEAARAGDMGRGFAVVADEVRALASRTQQSTDEIKKMIEQLQAGVKSAEATISESRERAVKTDAAAAEANDALLEIKESIQQINSMTIQIATAAEQQSATTEEINRNTTNIRDISQHVTDKAHSQCQGCDEMLELTNRQDHMLSKFKL